MLHTASVLSAGIIPVHRETSRYLLLRAYRYWDFPRGLVEPSEDPFDAACRELKEETGIDEITFPWGRQFRETSPYNRGKIARYYLGEVPGALESLDLRISREHHEFRWLPYEEARRLLVPRVQAVLDWARESTSQG